MDDKREECRIDLEATQRFRGEIPAIVDNLAATCNNKESFDHVSAEPIPSRETSLAILHRIGDILYPGYFVQKRLDAVNVGYYLGQEMTALFEELSEQITLAIRHDCLRHNQSCTNCGERGLAAAVEFLRGLPAMREALAKDIRAAHEGDPAAGSTDEIIFSYPGLFAITVYRIAHRLHTLEA
ncbi:MAG: serine acetyltransferase, partial [Proteobacteria bacterium]|nr:serine acetyltransferase [Pseudomonadota bacterium]